MVPLSAIIREFEMFNWRRLGAALAIVIAVSLMRSALAEVKPKVSVGSSGRTGIVIINGKPAIRFTADNGILEPLDRAKITSDRLAQLVATKLDPAAIYIKGNENSARVYIGEMMLCIVTPLDAKRNGTTATALANSWASNIKTLISMPALILGTKELVVPLGENRRVDVGGAATGPLYAKLDNEDIAIATPATEGRYITISGKKLGKALVDISSEGEHITLVVSVKKYAGSVPEIVLGEVTGNPCPASLVCYTARQAVSQCMILEPGANLEVGRVVCSTKSLAPGQSCRLNAEVRITGPDYIPLVSKAPVQIRNTGLSHEDAATLFYSNNPERVLKYQTLFAGKLEQNVPTRVLYHHQNMMGRRVHLIVELINPNDFPAKMRVFRGVSNPSVDTVGVGHVAGSLFLRDFLNDVSVFETIPPQSRLVLVSDMLNRKETASGILQVKQLDGSSVYVRITAAEPQVDNVSRGTIAKAPNPIILRLSDQIYPEPMQKLNADYTVGERWAFIPIGKHALNDTSSQKKLYGNYGVTYNIKVHIKNPTGETRKVSFVFDPTAGIASGIFMIDGKFATARNAQPPSEIPLASYSLRPKETRDVRVVTVPLAGSNYPATLIVRS